MCNVNYDVTEYDAVQRKTEDGALQGFPARWCFRGNAQLTKWQMIGNAVPPRAAAAAVAAAAAT